jgi:hypothetical protein
LHREVVLSTTVPRMGPYIIRNGDPVEQAAASRTAKIRGRGLIGQMLLHADVITGWQNTPATFLMTNLKTSIDYQFHEVRPEMSAS